VPLIIFFNIWVGVTLALYYLGPIDFPGSQQPFVLFYVTVCMLAFNIGARTVPVGAQVQYFAGVPRALVQDKRLALILLVLFCIISIAEVRATTGKWLFSPQTWLVSDESVYNEYQQRMLERGALSVLEMARTIFRALLFPIALTIFCAYFKRSKLMVFLFLFPMLGMSVARGTSKEIFDLAIIFLVVLLFYGARVKLIIAAMAVAPIVMLVFIDRVIARYGGEIPQCVTEEYCFNFDSVLAQISISLEVGYVLFTSYVAQGYEALARAIHVSHEFTFGIGHLPPLQRILEQVFSFNLSTYSERLTDAGWDTSWRWTSVYPVLVNDFDWVFTPLYFAVMGRVFSLAREAWRSRQEPTALAMTILITIFIAYSSANMQLAVSLEWTFATLVLIYLPVITAQVRNPRPMAALQHEQA
jgi:hypothetical protein